MIIFLYGGDTYRSRQKLRALKERYNKEIDKTGGGLAEIDGEKATLKDIHEKLGASSLFAAKRFVLIENIFSNRSRHIYEELTEHIKIYAAGGIADSEVILVFWDREVEKKNNPLFKLITGEPYSQEFKLLSNTSATQWLKKEAEIAGAHIKHEAAVYLSGLFGSDLWSLKNELDKLIAYKAGTQNKLMEGGNEIMIETDDVDELSRGQADENIFEFTDALSERNRGRSLELLEQELIAGAAETYLLFMIIRQIKILVQVKQALELNSSAKKIANDLKLHPFVVNKSIGQAKRFTLPLLKQLLSELVDIDAKVKSGKADLKTALSLMLARP